MGMGKLLKDLRERVEKLKAAGPAPAVAYQAPAGDVEADEAFAAARGGDVAALARLPELIAGRGWADWIGDLGRQATYQVVHRAAGGDPVWKAGLTEKVNRLWAELLGPDPSPLDGVLARRVVNSWVAVHALEIEQAVRPPSDPKAAAHLDRALSRAHRRLVEATRALAAVRRPRRPPGVAQVNVAAGSMVVNN